MTVQELLQSVSYLTDSEGQRTAVVIDIAMWREIAAQLEKTSPQFVEMPPDDTTTYEAAMTQLLQTLRDSAIETGIPDLAHEHDHYIHGTPKRGREDAP